MNIWNNVNISSRITFSSGQNYKAEKTGAEDENKGKNQNVFKRDTSIGRQSHLELFESMQRRITVDDIIQYQDVESENYSMKVDDDLQSIALFSKEGKKLGYFSFSDLYERVDSNTGKSFLISEHTDMDYDVIIMDAELKEDLKQVCEGKSIRSEELIGYHVNTNAYTGIQYIVRNGEEGRGGRILIQSEIDEKRFQELSDLYASKYPNLVNSQEEAEVYADLEIRGLVNHLDTGILSMNCNGVSYDDNSDETKNWAIRFNESVYNLISRWFANSKQDMSKISSWNGVLDYIDYERIWSDRELKAGHLYQ